MRDTGIGIPADELPRLFERFHRVEGARGRTHEGTGIGLALVQELVRLHGGTRHGRERAGTRQHLHGVPAARHRAPAGGARARLAGRPRRRRPADAYVEEALRWLPDDGASAPAPEAPAPPAERILLADDNADMRDYLRRLLEPRWQVETVADGRAALAAARRARPTSSSPT